ncbi:MAG: sel1 repeat family protein [Labilithrix sp.]|nr:sel1 repeat family protein [Labilithrix sp.]
MCPADPRPAAGDEEPLEEEEAPGDAFDLEALRRRADVPGLLAMAKAHRAGTAPGGRDFAKCLEAYRAAAELGSAEAEYAVALFYMNGSTVVAQDLKEGATRLRTAAEKGSLPAKVYLGNLYELGIHYKADPEKADVWYRNAARTSRVSADQGTPEWTRALADLGCVRQVLELAGELDEAERARLLARAKAHGHGLRIRDGGEAVDRATFVDSLASAEPTATPPPVAVDLAPAAPRDRKDTTPESREAKQRAETRRKETAEKPKPKKSDAKGAQVALGLGAFGYAILFMLAGVGAGYAATVGARELVSRGQSLPLLGAEARYLFPVVLALVGVLPTWLVYKLGTVLKAIAAGAALGAVGWVAWGTGRGVLHSDRALQGLAFSVAGFLAALLVLGLLGGAKPPRK